MKQYRIDARRLLGLRTQNLKLLKPEKKKKEKRKKKEKNSVANIIFRHRRKLPQSVGSCRNFLPHEQRLRRQVTRFGALGGRREELQRVEVAEVKSPYDGCPGSGVRRCG